MKYGIQNKSSFNENLEIHKKINSLTNTNDTMTICVKFPELSKWRVISQ